MARIAALLIVVGGIVAASPAAAQFGDIFGNRPPTPPASVPNGGFPQQPPPPAYPDQSVQPYPAQTAPAPQSYPGQPGPPYPSSAVESQPLPPPPGARVVAPAPASRTSPEQPVPPVQRTLATPPAANPASPATSQPAAGQPANTQPAAETPPTDIVVERPTPHIANRKAVFVGLDKITGRTIKFEAGIGETVQFGALQVTPRACYTRPPTEATNTDAFVEVDEVTLKDQIKRIFTGWMFASSPGLNAVDHPIYDVWLVDCASPIETSEAEPVAQDEPKPEHRRGAEPNRRPGRSLDRD